MPFVISIVRPYNDVPSDDMEPNCVGIVPWIPLERMFKNCKLCILPSTVGSDPVNSLNAIAKYSNDVSC